MLIEAGDGNSRLLIMPTYIEEAGDGIHVHYEKYNSFSAITDFDGRGYDIFDVSYDDFKAHAAMAKMNPQNPLGVVDLRDSTISRIPQMVQGFYAAQRAAAAGANTSVAFNAT